MKTIDRANRLMALVFAVFAVIFSSISFADDADDVMAVIQQYGDLEGDLEAQANLMRSDRVHIVGGNRQTNQAKNREIQLATRNRQEALNGGKTQYITTIEDLDVSIHGDVAVASFKQWWNIYPTGQEAILSTPAWLTLVLVKDGSGWFIKHTHASPVSVN
ncbi:MAG: nuclear transport factor 2 family protein [Pseudohongiellaceae bacterium]